MAFFNPSIAELNPDNPIKEPWMMFPLSSTSGITCNKIFAKSESCSAIDADSSRVKPV